MDWTVPGRVRGWRLLPIAITALAAFPAQSAAATASECTDHEAAPVFEAWGDDAGYTQVPGGSFEDGQTWVASGDTGPAPETDPFTISGPGGTSLRLGGGATATSLRFCINDYAPTLRFVAQAPVRGSHLKVSAIWTKEDGKVEQTEIADLNSDQFGEATLVSPLAFRSAVPDAGEARDVSLRFSVKGGSGGWILDDVFVSNAPAPSCGDIDVSQVFMPWGDNDYYAPVPGGAFEGSLSWLAEGAPALVPEGSPFEVGGEKSSGAVRLALGDSITSPAMCVNRYYPHVRFTARSNGPGSRLKVAALWTDKNGKPKVTKLDEQHESRYRGWGISGKVLLKGALPKEERVHDLRLRFYVDGGATAWILDDVYIDPYKRN